MKYFIIFACLTVGSFLHGFEFDLSLNPVEQEMVRDVMMVVATEDEETLMSRAGELIPKVMMIMSASPIKVMNYVCSDEELKECMLTSARSPFKWKLFEGGFSAQMNLERMNPDFAERIEVLLTNLSIDRKCVNEYIESLDWGSFALSVLGHDVV